MRYTKKPVTVEAIRFIGLTDFGDPQFDTAPTGGVVPEWLMEAMAAPEGDESSIWVSRVDGEKPILRIGSQTWLHEISENDWITNEDSNISSFNSEFFEAFFFPAEAQAEIAPAFTQAAKEGDTLTTPKDETPGDMLARLGMDAQAWAREFVDMFTGKSIGDDPASHGFDIMTAWFANAIMAGYDRGREQGWKEDAPYGHERVDPTFTQAAKDGERSLLLDMQSECIQLRVALTKARDYLMYEYPEMAAMCQKAIDCRPATSSEDCPKLEALDASGREAISALNPDDDIEAALEDGQSFVIGEGFRSA